MRPRGTGGGDRLQLREGTVIDAPAGPFDGATCILVLGLLADDGAKLDLLSETRRRLRPDSPLIMVDQCFDRDAPDFQQRLARYAAYARRSGVDPDTVAGARAALAASATVVSAERDEELLAEAGFGNVELFYRGMAWRGWVAYA